MIRVVTLLTDFGTRDAYVAQMKAAVLAICGDCHLVDITHEIPPQDIAAAARMLRRTAFWFTKGSVHVAVVDPGVGTDRAVIAASIAGHYFVAPDNGLLGEIAREFSLDRCVEINQSSSQSSTFHGRDIMAPAAARIAAGEPLNQLGVPVERPLVVLDPWQPTVSQRFVETSIAAIDHFGNASLTTSAELSGWLEQAVQQQARLRVLLGGGTGGGTGGGKSANVHCCRTYGDRVPGELVLLKGSQLDFEIAVVNGSAARLLGLSAGQLVSLHPA